MCVLLLPSVFVFVLFFICFVFVFVLCLFDVLKMVSLVVCCDVNTGADVCRREALHLGINKYKEVSIS